MSKIVAYIDGERVVFDSDDVYESLVIILTEDNREFYIFEDSNTAGEAVREYWEDMAQNDPQEFTALVGEQTLISWALGQSAGPGSAAVSSLDEWFDLWLTHPEEHFASYDGNEREFKCKHPDFKEYTVAYRHN